MLQASRPPMPELSKVARAWRRIGTARLHRVFSELRCFAIGWGEPFCFRCGWLPPTPEAADYPRPAMGRPDRRIERAWDAASGWLERAHLIDHQHGGGAEPCQLVPLCPLCHERQPQCRDRATAIAFVNGGADVSSLMGMCVQMLTDEHYRDLRRPGKERASRILWRVRAHVGTALDKEREAPRPPRRSPAWR